MSVQEPGLTNSGEPYEIVAIAWSAGGITALGHVLAGDPSFANRSDDRYLHSSDERQRQIADAPGELAASELKRKTTGYATPPRADRARHGHDGVGTPHEDQRCGFSREGLLRSHVPFKGARRDSVIYSLLPGELT